MRRQNPAQLFLSIFLRAAVIILGIMVVVVGGLLIGRGVRKHIKGDDVEPLTTANVGNLTEVGTHDDLLMNTTELTTEIATEETTVEENYSSSTDKMILVLNSTEQIGLAGGWCSKLNDNGYGHTDASDYSTPLSVTKIVAKEDGVGKDLLQYFEGAEYTVGEVNEGVAFETGTYDIIIILGTDQTTE